MTVIPTGEERNKALASWEHAGRLRAYTVLGHWDANQKRMKTRHVTVFNADKSVSFTYDGRLPYPPEDVFARIALAVMALT